MKRESCCECTAESVPKIGTAQDSCLDLARSKCTEVERKFADSAFFARRSEGRPRHSGDYSVESVLGWWRPLESTERLKRKLRRRCGKNAEKVGEASNPGPPGARAEWTVRDGVMEDAGSDRGPAFNEQESQDIELLPSSGGDGVSFKLAKVKMAAAPEITAVRKTRPRLKDDLVKDFWATTGAFNPTRTFKGSREGMCFKLGGCGLGYYRDDGCGSDMTAQDDRENCEPVSLLLDVLIPPVTADNCKPQDSEVCHMRKPRKGPDRRLMSVNPNALSSVIQTIRQKGVPDDVSFVATQEAKVLSREIIIRKQDLADLGWDAYINPCNGDANSRSSGVALLARSGWRVTKLTAANTDVRGLNSARLGAWAVEGCGWFHYLCGISGGRRRHERPESRDFGQCHAWCCSYGPSVPDPGRLEHDA